MPDLKTAINDIRMLLSKGYIKEEETLDQVPLEDFTTDDEEITEDVPAKRETMSEEQARAIVIELRRAGFSDAYFSPSKGFHWTKYPGTSYITLEFGKKYYNRSGFYLSQNNKFVVDDEILKEPKIVNNMINTFKEEYNKFTELLNKINGIYPIVY